jgi:hypothetical protein
MPWADKSKRDGSRGCRGRGVPDRGGRADVCSSRGDDQSGHIEDYGGSGDGAIGFTVEEVFPFAEAGPMSVAVGEMIKMVRYRIMEAVETVQR